MHCATCFAKSVEKLLLVVACFCFLFDAVLVQLAVADTPFKPWYCALAFVASMANHLLKHISFLLGFKQGNGNLISRSATRTPTNQGILNNEQDRPHTHNRLFTAWSCSRETPSWTLFPDKVSVSLSL